MKAGKFSDAVTSAATGLISTTCFILKLCEQCRGGKRQQRKAQQILGAMDDDFARLMWKGRFHVEDHLNMLKKFMVALIEQMEPHVSVFDGEEAYVYCIALGQNRYVGRAATTTTKVDKSILGRRLQEHMLLQKNCFDDKGAKIPGRYRILQKHAMHHFLSMICIKTSSKERMVFDEAVATDRIQPNGNDLQCVPGVVRYNRSSWVQGEARSKARARLSQTSRRKAQLEKVGGKETLHLVNLGRIVAKRLVNENQEKIIREQAQTLSTWTFHDIYRQHQGRSGEIGAINIASMGNWPLVRYTAESKQPSTLEYAFTWNWWHAQKLFVLYNTCKHFASKHFAGQARVSIRWLARKWNLPVASKPFMCVPHNMIRPIAKRWLLDISKPKQRY